MYYSDIFGPVPGNLFQIDDDIWDNVDNLDEIGNYNLCIPFYKDEIKRALFQMEKIKLIRLTIFLLNSIKVVGGIIRKDIIEVFEEFHSEKDQCK
jgi:hypothetical protein